MALSASSSLSLNCRDSDSTTSLESSFQYLINLFVKNFFLMSNLNVPLCSLWLCPHPITNCLGDASDPHMTTTNFQAESDKVTPELNRRSSPGLTAPAPQPLLIGYMLQTLHQCFCPSLDLLQLLSVLSESRCPEQDAVLKLWPQQCCYTGRITLLFLLATIFLI